MLSFQKHVNGENDDVAGANDYQGNDGIGKVFLGAGGGIAVGIAQSKEKL